jgi:spore cortex biosynthesis protein YabQ
MSLTTQFYTMISMIGMGCWLGAALDTYGRFLKRPKRAHWFVFLNDVLFWFIQGLIIFYILLLVNQGELRFYVFIAILCGFAGYRSLLQTIYLRILEVIINSIIMIYQFIKRTCYILLVKPIQALLQLIIVVLLGLLRLLLSLAKIILVICKTLLKIALTPFKWIGILLWKLIPHKIKNFIGIYLKKFAGVSKKVENMKLILLKWWKKIRKS